MYIARDASGNLHRETGPSVVTNTMKIWSMGGKLHRPDGPAVVTEFGGKQFWWRGISIPETMWYKSETMSLNDVMAITNVELRRSVLEKVGYEKVLSQGAVKILHKDEKTGAILYRLDMPEDDREEPLVVVRLIDSTPHKNDKGDLVSKVYYLRVPPTMKTCIEAVAWTFDLPIEKYLQLELET